MCKQRDNIRMLFHSHSNFIPFTWKRKDRAVEPRRHPPRWPGSNIVAQGKDASRSWENGHQPQLWLPNEPRQVTCQSLTTLKNLTIQDPSWSNILVYAWITPVLSIRIQLDFHDPKQSRTEEFHLSVCERSKLWFPVSLYLPQASNLQGILGPF